MRLSVRQAVPDDGAALARIHLSAWRSAYRGLIADGLLYGSWAEGRARWWASAVAGKDPPLVYVAGDEADLLGFCATDAPSSDYDEDGTVAKIMALNVRADTWRSGVGTALMDETLAAFRRDGRRSASLWVLEGNDRALAFYGRFGFEPDGSTDTLDAGVAAVFRMRLSL
ncbi:MAG TPA: GNAT family N-acetyltransferase [Solirubrobacteraceae bacterium]|jgi:ribosomal protein S18 acetylase RimI-like enzyme|nr:GNAT family N-acetyltransferase [Solirubrobacteraceae bacterium]